MKAGEVVLGVGGTAGALLILYGLYRLLAQPALVQVSMAWDGIPGKQWTFPRGTEHECEVMVTNLTAGPKVYLVKLYFGEYQGEPLFLWAWAHVSIRAGETEVLSQNVTVPFGPGEFPMWVDVTDEETDTFLGLFKMGTMITT